MQATTDAAPSEEFQSAEECGAEKEEWKQEAGDTEWKTGEDQWGGWKAEEEEETEKRCWYIHFPSCSAKSGPHFENHTSVVQQELGLILAISRISKSLKVCRSATSRISKIFAQFVAQALCNILPHLLAHDMSLRIAPRTPQK